MYGILFPKLEQNKNRSSHFGFKNSIDFIFIPALEKLLVMNKVQLEQNKNRSSHFGFKNSIDFIFIPALEKLLVMNKVR